MCYFVALWLVSVVLWDFSNGQHCGIKPTPAQAVGRRIIGGRNADEGEFPWLVVMNVKATRNPYCTGSLLSQKWVLTAGHCFKSATLSELQVEAGRVNLHDSPKHVSNMKQIFIPQEFSQEDPYAGFDIALVLLETPMTFEGGDLVAICLPPAGTNFVGPVTAIGWGCTDENKPATSWLLQAIDLLMFPNDACEKKYKKPVVMGVCAGIPSHCGRGVCKGDSGGPVQQFMDDRYVVAGVLSYGRNGCLGVYTGIAHYLDWINEVLTANGGL